MSADQLDSDLRLVAEAVIENLALDQGTDYDEYPGEFDIHVTPNAIAEVIAGIPSALRLSDPPRAPLPAPVAARVEAVRENIVAYLVTALRRGLASPRPSPPGPYSSRRA